MSTLFNSQQTRSSEIEVAVLAATKLGNRNEGIQSPKQLNLSRPELYKSCFCTSFTLPYLPYPTRFTPPCLPCSLLLSPTKLGNRNEDIQTPNQLSISRSELCKSCFAPALPYPVYPTIPCLPYPVYPTLLTSFALTKLGNRNQDILSPNQLSSSRFELGKYPFCITFTLPCLPYPTLFTLPYPTLGYNRNG